MNLQSIKRCLYMTFIIHTLSCYNHPHTSRYAIFFTIKSISLNEYEYTLSFHVFGYKEHVKGFDKPRAVLVWLEYLLMYSLCPQKLIFSIILLTSYKLCQGHNRYIVTCRILCEFVSAPFERPLQNHKHINTNLQEA